MANLLLNLLTGHTHQHSLKKKTPKKPTHTKPPPPPPNIFKLVKKYLQDV